MVSVITQENNQIKDIEQYKQNLDAVPAIDLIPIYSSQLEREIFNLFFISLDFSLTDLTPKYIEKTIQTVYIFDRAENKIRLQEKKGKISVFLEEFILLFRKYKHIESALYKNYAVTEGEEKQIEYKYVASQIRLKYFTPDENMSAEAKRLKLVTEINKIVDKEYKIPSHSAIKSSLLNLETQRYLDIKKRGAKTFWYLNPEFYQRWQARHNQLIDEFEKYRKESAEQSAANKDIDATVTMVNKYLPIVLEFYDIDWRRDEKLERPLSLIRRYFDDIKNLTRY